MLRRIPKVLLLVALLTAFLASSVPAFAGHSFCFCSQEPHDGGCHLDKKTFQCVNTGCPGFCAFI
jgi:hypothetical protein